MEDLSIPISFPTFLYSDSKSAINIVNNPVQHDRMKHVRIDCHFVKQELESSNIKLTYVPT